VQENTNQRFQFIDGLRGIAALSVVLFHIHLAIKKHTAYALPFFLEEVFFTGYLGIQIFFVLSGFVIAYSVRNASNDLSFFSRFFIRRSLRLDPPYWVVIILTLLLAGIAGLTFKSGTEFPFSGTQIFYNLIYLPDLMQVPLIIPVAWTLCVEFQFYLVFALLILMIQYTGLNKRMALVLWGVLSLFSILQNTPWAVIHLKPVTFIPHWYSFFLGCTVCWAMLDKKIRAFLWINYLIVLSLSFWTSTPHAAVSLATALLIDGVSLVGGLHRVLKERFFQYTGRLSYSLYLIHWPIGMKLVDLGYKMGGDLMASPAAVALLFIFTLLVTLGAADLFYRLVEKPSHEFSRDIVKSRFYAS
jgi:peptidoglycan/LPS O-acetylase OafA/YrhL